MYILDKKINYAAVSPFRNVDKSNVSFDTPEIKERLAKAKKHQDAVLELKKIDAQKLKNRFDV